MDLERIGILAPELREHIATAGRAPVLSPYFESSVAGLYFVGATAANSFGPMMRFSYGSRFVARRLSRHLAEPVTGDGAGRGENSLPGVTSSPAPRAWRHWSGRTAVPTLVFLDDGPWISFNQMAARLRSRPCLTLAHHLPTSRCNRVGPASSCTTRVS